MTRYVLAKKALEDVSTILLYLEERGERMARRFEHDLVAEFVAWGTLPARYRRDTSVAPPSVRVRVFRSDLIYYDGEVNPTAILRVVHGSRDLPTLRDGFDVKE